MAFVTHTVRLIQAAQKAYARKWTFLAGFLVVFFFSYSCLVALDLVPDMAKHARSEALKKAAADRSIELVGSPQVSGFVNSSSNVQAPTGSVAAGEHPLILSIPAIGLRTSVKNPTSTNVETLDEALLTGAVRYPTSATLGEDGNVILFGHSSYLPVVHNQAYKTFDGIQKLAVGDRIVVVGETTTYVYAVDTVAKASTSSDAIPLTVVGQKLTLATCDSFGKKSDRFVVSASLVESHPNGS